jgi:hypothetical protein
VKKWVGRILMIAIALALLNDFGRYLTAMYHLDVTSRAMAIEAGDRARGQGGSAWPTAYAAAAAGGIEITAFQQTPRGVVAQTRMTIGDTFIIGPVYAIATGAPVRSPFPITQSVKSLQ